MPAFPGFPYIHTKYTCTVQLRRGGRAAPSVGRSLVSTRQSFPPPGLVPFRENAEAAVQGGRCSRHTLGLAGVERDAALFVV